MKRHRKTRTFKRELILSFFTITLVSIVILGAFQVFQLSTLVEENKEKQFQTTVFLDDYIHNYVHNYQKAVEMLADRIQPLFLEEDLASIEKQLEQVKVNYSGFVNLYVGNEAGESLVFYPNLRTDGIKRENHDFSDRSYYHELRETKQPVLSSVFHGRVGTDLMLVTTVAPIMSDGAMVGYVLGAFDLNVLADDVKDRIDDAKSSAIVLDQDDNVIVHPEVNTRKQLVNLKDAPFVNELSKFESQNSGDYTAIENGEEYYFTFIKNNQLGWKVWIATPTRYINDTYEDAILMVLLCALLTIIFLIVVSIFFANRFERALQNVLFYIKQYRDYTRGFKSKPTFQTSPGGTKEIVELYNHFGDLIEEVEQNRNRLIRWNKELEDRVKERTIILEKKNLELRAVNKLITSVSAKRDIIQFIQHCLVQIKPYMENRLHVIFHDVSVTADEVTAITDVQTYLNEKGIKQQYIEPIQIERNLQGFLVVELNENQVMNAYNQEFLQTFATSLAIMLDNKFLFEKARNKHAQLEAILESLSEGLMLLNKNEIEYVNDYFKQIVFSDTNYKLIDMNDMYKRFKELFRLSEKELQSFIEQDESVLILEHVDENNRTKSYKLHSFSVYLDDQVIGKGLLLRDVTKEAEIDTLKNNLISLTSHEFKTPITNIRGSVETLLREDVEWEAEFERELLEGVHEDIERIQHLVSDWMDISKINSGTMFIEKELVHGEQVIEKSIQQIPKELQKGLEISFKNIWDKPVYFYGDEIRIQQVLVNLFMNAIRYNDQAMKKIDVTINKTATDVIITVKDNGIGISNDHLKKIFTHFYQVDATATRRTGGTGLGLAICRGIMEAHHGKINVESELNKGSTFTLFFPLEKELH